MKHRSGAIFRESACSRGWGSPSTFRDGSGAPTTVLKQGVIIDDASKGEGKAIDAGVLFRAHGRFVARLISRLGAPSHELDDLVQEVFIIVLKKGVVPTGPPTTAWLAAIAWRVLANRRRWQLRHPTHTADLESIASAHTLADDVLEAKGAMDRVHAALAKLPLERRVVFVLHELEGETCESIARGLELPLGTVYSRLHKARAEFLRAHERLTKRRNVTPMGAVPAMSAPPPLHESPAVDARLRRDLAVFIAMPVSFDVELALERFETVSRTSALASASMRTKLWLGTLIVVGGPVALWIATRTPPDPGAEPSAARPTARSGPSVPAPTQAPAAPPAASRAPVDLHIVDVVGVPPADLPPPARTPSRKARRAPPSVDPQPMPTEAPASTPEPPAADDRLRAEMLATQRARTLVRHDPASALKLARSTEAEFPAGVFSEERQAIIILALAAVGRTSESSAHAHEFLERFPQSPHRKKILEVTGP